MNMKVFVAALCIIALSIAFFMLFQTPSTNLPYSKVCFQQTCFTVELALTPEQQATGLMSRTHLDPDKGMLFVFQQEGVYPFWMKNTLIPLDMIWLDSNGTVVFIGRNEQPCSPVTCPSINPEKNAKYVLEVNAGTAQSIGLDIGNRMTFDVQG